MIRMLAPLYGSIIRPLLFRLDPERAHNLALGILARLPARNPVQDPPELLQKLWDLDFPNPLGLAAGMDKDLIAVAAWENLGFGFAELGTITPRVQPGNARPRLWRLPRDRALVNRLGFPSRGIESAFERMRSLRARGVRIRIGLNFGPNRETLVERVVDDYASLMSRLGPLADFVVVNLSSPNTPGLRGWQAPDRMNELFRAVLEAGSASKVFRRRPLLVKISPDLETRELEDVCATVVKLGLDGIVATNTTITRTGLHATGDFPGGLSGEPLKLRARSVIRQVYRMTGGRVPIIGVGGVACASDAYEHICAGASMVELYTALVYEGPAVPIRIKSGLLSLLRRDGLRSISSAVGVSS